MKIYISGAIAEKSAQEAFVDFETMTEKLQSEKFNPVNSFKIAPPAGVNWNDTDYIAEGIRQLLDCEAIYMMKGWETSKRARMEYAIAKEMEIKIMFQARRHSALDNLEDAKRICIAVCEACGVSLEMAKKRNRETTCLFPRQICAYVLRMVGFRSSVAAEIFEMHHSNMYHSYQVISGYIATNKPFREKVERIVQRLKDKGLYKMYVYNSEAKCYEIDSNSPIIEGEINYHQHVI